MTTKGSASISPSAISPGAFRLALASAVVLDHFYGILLGRAAVYIFFVLSGYWITKMWSDRYAETAQPYVTYMVSRFWRLAPIMLVGTLFAVAVTLGVLGVNPLAQSGVDPAHQVFSHLFFLGYSQLPTPRLLDPAWSLDMEMRFYLVAPFLVMFLNRYGVQKFLFLILALTAARVWLPGSGLHMLALFAVGMIAAKTQWRPSRHIAAGSLLGIAAVFVGLALSGHSDILTDRSLYSANTALNWALAALAIPYAIGTCHEDSGERDRMFGDLSYSLYLVHWPIVTIMRASESATVLTASAWIVVSFGLAFFALTLVDRPVQKWRARWVSARWSSGQAGLDRAEPAI